MRRLIIIYILIIVFVIYGCKKETEYGNKIIGKWEWIMTSFGDYNFPRTPESVDSTYYIEFNTDGYYYLYSNSDQLIKKIRYFPGNEDQFTSISFENYESSEIVYGYNITNDTLRIGIIDQIYPVTDIYKRVN